MTNEFEYLPRNVRFSKYGMSILIWCCLQLSCMQTKFRPCKLNFIGRTVYTVFRNIRYSSKSSNVLNTVFSKQNISCFEIRRPSASAVDIYRAQRKHINYSIRPMRISRHDLRRRYSNSLVIDAGSQFSLRACSKATTGCELNIELFVPLKSISKCLFLKVYYYVSF
jgi:hypothetical protein